MMRLALFLFLVSTMAFASGGSYGGGGGGGGAVWGGITGTLSNQTDLNTALGLKAPLAGPTFTGTVTIPTLAMTAAQTTLTGSAGTTLCSEPNQGSSYKKVVCYLSGYSTASQTYTYPTAFVHTPYIYGLPGAVAVASSNTTTLTFTSAVTLTGFLFLEGY